MNQREILLKKALLILKPKELVHTPSWTDAISEFDTYSNKKSKQTVYIRLYQTPSEYSYAEDSHQRINLSLSGLQVDCDVKIVERYFDKTFYVLLSQRNYLSLLSYLKIKADNFEEINQRVILNILQMFTLLVPRLIDHKILTSLTLSNLCMDDEEIRLCDYGLLFHPCNARSNNSELQKLYFDQIRLLLCQLLLTTQENISKKDEDTLLNKLIQKDPLNRYSVNFISIVKIILEKYYLPAKLITEQIKRLRYEQGQFKDSLTCSTVSLKESFGEDIVISKITPTSSVGSADLAKGGKSKPKTHICITVLFVAIFFVAVAIVGIKFLHRDIECKANEYKFNKKCYACYQGCTSCLGESNNQCTKCWGSFWLLVLNDAEKSGKCAEQCIGQELTGRKCMVDINEYNKA